LAAPRAGGIRSARYKKRSATHRLLRIETAALCCTRSLGDGSSTISISSVRGTPHAHGAMGLLQVKPEGGEGERDGVQEGGNSCPQGRTLSAWHLEQKKSSQGRLRQGTANITQGARTAGIWTWPFSGAVMSLGALSSSSHRHSILKLARPLTLLPYHTLLLQVADPQSHRTGLFTRLKRIVAFCQRRSLAGSIAEREADGACSRREEISSGAVSRRGMHSASIMDSLYPCRSRKKRILTSSHTRPGPMTARLSAPVTVASCIPPFARTNVAPMMQEKELSDPAVAVPPTLQASRGQTAQRSCRGRIPSNFIVISRLLLA
jgi:hypothetical protein